MSENKNIKGDIYDKIIDLDSIDLSFDYEEVKELHRKFNSKDIKFKEINIEDIIHSGFINRLKDFRANNVQFEYDDLMYIIYNMEYSIDFELLVIKYIKFHNDSNIKKRFCEEFLGYIKLTLIRELIEEYLKSIKRENQFVIKFNYYDSYKEIINEISSISKKINYCYKDELNKLIEDYEIELKQFITRVDLIYGLFSVLTCNIDEKGGTDEKDPKNVKKICIIKDLEELRLKRELRGYDKPRTMYELELKIKDLMENINLYFKIENEFEDQIVNKDFNQYLILKSLKGIEAFYLNSYTDKPDIKTFNKVTKNIDKKYYDFFLREEIIELIEENEDIIELNLLISESVNILKRFLKEMFIKRISIDKKIDLINKLNNYHLKEIGLGDFKCIPKETIFQKEMDYYKIKRYIIN